MGTVPTPLLVSREHQTIVPIQQYEVGSVKFAALGDRVIVREDEFKSGYECRACDGKGKVPCANCNGTGQSPTTKFARCSFCAGRGSVDCGECDGKGGVLVVPEQSQRRPSSGQIVSVGEDCKVLRVGENVLYSNFAGYAVDLDRAGISECLRILHEKEILCRVEGHLELRTIRNKTEVTSI